MINIELRRRNRKSKNTEKKELTGRKRRGKTART